MDHHARSQSFVIYFVGVLLLLVPYPARARQQDRRTAVIKFRISPDDAPIRILGFRLPSGPGHEPLIHLRNASSVSAASVSVERIIHIRPSGIVRPEQDVFWHVERAIAPGADVWAAQSNLASDQLLMDARELRSSCLFIDVSIARVNFKDGSTWKNNGHSHLHPQDARGSDCINATASGDEMEQITGFTVIASPASYSSTDVQSYSVTCSLESKGEGRVFGTCPF